MARRKSTKKESNWAIAAVVAIVLFASLFLLRADAPEHVLTRSEDGAVVFEGVTRTSTPLFISQVADVGELGVQAASGFYEISFIDGGQLLGGELVMYLASDVDVTEFAVYTYDPSVLDWVALPTVFDLTAGSISAELNLFDTAVVFAGNRVDTQ